MAVTSVDLDPALIERARELTGERSEPAVPRPCAQEAHRVKAEGCHDRGDRWSRQLAEELGAPVVSPGESGDR